MYCRTFPFRPFALGAYLMLIFWVGIWHGVISPHPHVNPFVITLIWLLPLTFPLKGIIRGDPYTHAWANFILMFYFLHSLTLLWTDEGERYLALIEFLITMSAFIGNLMYAKQEGKAKKLGLKKLSQIEKEEALLFDLNDEIKPKNQTK